MLNAMTSQDLDKLIDIANELRDVTRLKTEGLPDVFRAVDGALHDLQASAHEEMYRRSEHSQDDD